MMEDIGFLSDKQVRFLENIDGNYLSQAAKLSDTTYSHVAQLRNLFLKKNWLKVEREGRTATMKLTPKGKELLDCYLRIKKLTKD